MDTTAWLRVVLLAALAGCDPVTGTIDRTDTDVDTDTDTDTAAPICDEDEATPLLATSDYTGPGLYQACGPLPDSGACPEDDEGMAVLRDGLPPVEDPGFCWWSLSQVCGPLPRSEGDSCCYTARVEVLCEGRPLTAAGEARTARAVRGTEWLAELAVLPRPHGLAADLARRGWRRAALAEHASVASFARFVTELLALGAPPSLVEEATRAQADEIRHARLAFSVLERLTGEATAPGPLALDGIVPRTDPGAFLAATLLEGCLNETLAAAEAAEAARRCPHPALSAVLDTIAEDEARHAALAWRTIRWLLGAQPALRPLARALVADALRPRSDATSALDHVQPDATWHDVGLLPPAARRRLRHRIRAEVVRPVAEAVIGELDDRCAEA